MSSTPAMLNVFDNIMSKKMLCNSIIYALDIKLFRFTLADIEIPEKGKHQWRWWMMIFLPLWKLAALWPCILATMKRSQ